MKRYDREREEKREKTFLEGFTGSCKSFSMVETKVRSSKMEDQNGTSAKRSETRGERMGWQDQCSWKGWRVNFEIRAGALSHSEM